MFKLKKLSLHILISLLSFSAQADEDCNITVAYENEPPFLYKDENGQMSGLDKELVEFFANKAGCKVEWVLMPWARALEMMKTGGVLMGTNASDTEERKKYANFVPYRDSTPNLLFVKKEMLENLKADKLEDFINKTKQNIGLVIGYQYEDEIEDLMKNPKYKKRFERVADGESNISKLMNNRLEGFITEVLLGNYFIKKHNLQGKIVHYDFNFGFNSADKTSLMISKKGDPDNKITDRLNKATQEFKNSEEYKNITKKYF